MNYYFVDFPLHVFIAVMKTRACPCVCVGGVDNQTLRLSFYCMLCQLLMSSVIGRTLEVEWYTTAQQTCVGVGAINSRKKN